MRDAFKDPILLSVSLLPVALLAVPAGAARAKATLAVVDESPVTVIGRGFLAKERVTLRTSVAGHLHRKVVTANRLGRFTAQFDGVEAAQCSPYAVSAVGARGSRATTRKIAIPPACGIPIQP